LGPPGVLQTSSAKGFHQVGSVKGVPEWRSAGVSPGEVPSGESIGGVRLCRQQCSPRGGPQHGVSLRGSHGEGPLDGVPFADPLEVPCGVPWTGSTGRRFLGFPCGDAQIFPVGVPRMWYPEGCPLDGASWRVPSRRRPLEVAPRSGSS
jgi:hypothetical protein